MGRMLSPLRSVLEWLVPRHEMGPQGEWDVASVELPGPWSIGIALGMHSDGGADSSARTEIGELVAQFKYGGERRLVRRLAPALAQVLRTHVEDEHVDVVTHVPTSRRTSYEPACELAIAVARALGSRALPRLLRPIRAIQPQKDLTTLWEKRQNVEGAFAVRRPGLVRGRRVLLVDDIYDSGATLAEAWRVLREAGSQEIVVAVLTRTRYLAAQR